MLTAATLCAQQPGGQPTWVDPVGTWALKPWGHPPLTGVMVVGFGIALALVYAIDCGFACSQLARLSVTRREAVMFAVAALLLASGAVCAGVPGGLPRVGAIVLLGGVICAAAAYLSARRLPGAPLRIAGVPVAAADHPWPNDPIPLQARGVERPPVMSLTLPAIGSVVELNQN